MLPNILLPTRITDHSTTLIDNIFSSISCHESFSGNFIYSISDHLPQFLLLRKPPIKQYKKSENVMKDWKNFDQVNFVLDFLDINWENKLYHLTNIYQAFEVFNSLIQDLIERHVPTVQITRRQIKTQSKPWITQGIIKSISKRNFFFRKFSKANNPITKSEYYRQYKLYRNVIVSLTRRSKNNYYSHFFSQHANNMLKVWEGVKQIIGSNSSNSNSSLSVRIDDSLTSDPLRVSNGFNDFFTSIADSVRSRIGPTNRHFSHYLENPNRNSVYIS